MIGLGKMINNLKPRIKQIIGVALAIGLVVSVILAVWKPWSVPIPPEMSRLVGSYSAEIVGLLEPFGTPTITRGFEELELFANGTFAYKFTDSNGNEVVKASRKSSHSWTIEEVPANYLIYGVELNFADVKIPLGWSFFGKSYAYVIVGSGNEFVLCHSVDDFDSPTCLRKNP